MPSHSSPGLFSRAIRLGSVAALVTSLLGEGTSARSAVIVDTPSNTEAGTATEVVTLSGGTLILTHSSEPDVDQPPLSVPSGLTIAPSTVYGGSFTLGSSILSTNTNVYGNGSLTVGAATVNANLTVNPANFAGLNLTTNGAVTNLQVSSSVSGGVLRIGSNNSLGLIKIGTGLQPIDVPYLAASEAQVPENYFGLELLTSGTGYITLPRIEMYIWEPALIDAPGVYHRLPSLGQAAKVGADWNFARFGSTNHFTTLYVGSNRPVA